MGSGHFLVAAVDHIEERMSSFLADRPIQGVINELARLEAAAVNELGDTRAEVETATLLRRQIARRCVYGVDRNDIAVELARLSIWIHTFVPGLPLSFLNHNLVVGDSLTGIGTIAEVADFLDGDMQAADGTISIFAQQITDWLGTARDALRRLGNASDATPTELKDARAAHDEAMEKVEPVSDLFDLVCAMRRDEANPFPAGLDESAIANHPQLDDARKAGDAYGVLHFPVRFPEVFIRERAGFDVIVGNPPWDKVKFEPQQFWVTRDPGFNALGPTQRDARMRELRRLHPADAALEEQDKTEREAYQAMIAASYRHQGVGHYDYAKLFLERALSLLAPTGRLGYVLPRQALVLAGWAKLRRAAARRRADRGSAGTQQRRMAVRERRTTATWSCCSRAVPPRPAIRLTRRRPRVRGGHQPGADRLTSCRGRLRARRRRARRDLRQQGDPLVRRPRRGRGLRSAAHPPASEVHRQLDQRHP